MDFSWFMLEPAIVAAKSGLCPSLSRPCCGSAPAFSKASAVAHAAMAIAALKTERPEASTTVAVALYSKSKEIAKLFFWSTATSKGDRPLASLPWLGFAPSFSNCDKTSFGDENCNASKTKDPSCFASVQALWALRSWTGTNGTNDKQLKV